MDLNGDGYTDLVVGAPFYEATGAIYIYMNGPDGVTNNPQLTPRFKIEGREIEGRFGFAMANAGDLDNDGYSDLVVGAPYEGSGRVYVFNGARNFDSLIPSQVIAAKDLPVANIKTFGYSLGGGYDLDMNNHSDIVVGAFASDAAFVVRSRPVIDIVTWFKDRRVKSIDPSLNGCQADVYSSEFCFAIESCFLIKNFPHNIASIHLRYTLSAEIFPGGRRVSRIRFGDARSNATHVSEKTVLVEKGKLTGTKMLGYVRIYEVFSRNIFNGEHFDQ